jgi:hypothetical protein
LLIVQSRNFWVKKMRMKGLPIAVALAVTVVKAINLIMQRLPLEAGGWLLAGCWFIWIAVAYRYDKDLPMIGPLGFDNGTNQAVRGRR